MSDVKKNLNKLLSLKGDFYDHLASLSKKSGFIKNKTEPDISTFLNETLKPLALETDDVKYIFRVPKVVADDREQLKLFLLAQVDQVVS